MSDSLSPDGVEEEFAPDDDVSSTVARIGPAACLPRVLCVASEVEVLEMLTRFLSPSFEIETATDPIKGLRMINESIAPFSAILATGRLRFMSGVAFLRRSREFSPNSGRVLLTARTEGDTAIQAVNSGAVFRVLMKPCAPETLLATIVAAAEHYRLVETERILLEQTVRGAVNALTEVLTIASPTAFARGMRLKSYVGPISEVIEIENIWEIEVAALISQLGCVSLPASLLERMHTGQSLDAAEQRMVEALPSAAVAFIQQIPRLESVRDILRHLNTRFDGRNSDGTQRDGRRIPIGARILKAVGDLDWLLAGGMPIALALGNLSARTGWYDPEVLAAIREKFGPGAQVGVRRVRLRHLQEGMLFAADVKGPRGLLLAARGQEVGPVLINRLSYVWDTTLLDMEVPVCARGEYEQKGT